MLFQRGCNSALWIEGNDVRLRNGDQTFQRYIDTALRGLDFTFVYIDDILIASHSQDEHVQHLHSVLQRFAQFGLTLNRVKCAFSRFLGYHVTAEGIKPLEHRVNVIMNFSKPKRIQELRRLLGMFNFYCRCLPHAATVLP